MHEWAEGQREEREREPRADSPLSVKPDKEPHPKTLRSLPELKPRARSLTNEPPR